MAIRSKLSAKIYPQQTPSSKEIVAPGIRPGEGGVNPTVAPQLSITSN
jgi:hypothetical protein